MMDVVFKWVLAKAKDYFLKNYKTTLAGLLGVAATQIPALAPFKEPILAAIVALVAILSKDADQTGTTEQPRTVTQAMTEAPAPVVMLQNPTPGE